MVHLQFDLSFSPNTYPGKYFAFEGIDGSGKTTQVHTVAEYFTKQGKEVVITKEPTNSIVGEVIKRVVHEEMQMPAVSLQYLFAADRAIHIQEEVIPALKKGCIVLSDRSFWSALAYGITSFPSSFVISNLSGVEDEKSRFLGDLSTMSRDDKDKERNRLLVAYNILSLYGGFLVPDKTFVIRLPAEIAMDRVQKRKLAETLYEKTAILQRVEEEYIWMAEKFPQYLVLIDGKKSVAEVFLEIVSCI